MNTQLSPESIVTILQPIGHLDTYSVLRLRMQLERATVVQPAYVVIDLSQVSFLDSRALATLVNTLKRCRAGGGDLYLSSPSQPVRMILELTRLHKAIKIFPSQTAAVAACTAILSRGLEGAKSMNLREPIAAG